jgi:predicted nucleic acid-binding protein
MIVVDASAILEVLLSTPAASRIAKRLFAPGETLHAPHLLDVEVTHVLRRYWMAGDLSVRDGLDALHDLAELPLTRYPHSLSLPRVWELRQQFTAYDAVYLALAESLHAPFVTCDRALASSQGHRAKVELMSQNLV